MGKMTVFVACEFSGTVRNAFAARGHDVWSCDLLPSEDNSARHYTGDVFEALAQFDAIDLLIAHPPCTYLANSGVSWLHKDESRWDKMRQGAMFFRQLMEWPADKVAVENPIMHGYAKKIIGVNQSQVIQPYMFGHLERKATCLWLRNLPVITPENNVYDEMMALPKNERERVHYMPPTPNRWRERSRTYQGIANAMANQWGN